MNTSAPISPTKSAFARAADALRGESGAATAEYAIATLAAVGLAGLLVVVLRGDDIKGMLTDLIHRALSL
jgi:Flp pilus assembly pilin Flp